MTTKDILKVVADAQPEMMGKIAEMIRATDTLYPALVPEIMKDFDVICSVVSEKTAAAGSPNFRAFAIGAGGTVAGGLLGAITTDLYDAAKRGLTKGRNFSRIMEHNPTLKREVDKKQLTMAYDALHRFAPDFTADPMVGGALLKQVAELPQMSHKTIFELIGAEKNINDGKGRHFAEMSKLGPLLVPDQVSASDKYRAKSEMTKLKAQTEAQRESQKAQAKSQRSLERMKLESPAQARRNKALEAVKHEYAKKLEDYRAANRPATKRPGE